MKVIVGEHKCTIDKTPVNELEVNVTDVEFEFDEKIPVSYVKKAFFTQGDVSKEIFLSNNQCKIPNEVLYQKGQVRLGVIAYEVQDDVLIERFNPTPTYFSVWEGSLIEADNTEPITPTDKEQMEQAVQDALNDISDAIENAERLDIDVEKVDDVATVTITKQDGTTKSVDILDGEKGEKGDKGETGAQGPQGIQGEQGPMGPQGEAFTIKKTYSSVAQMNADFNNMNVGDYVMIANSVETEDNAKLYTRGEYAWIFITDFSGATGIQGEQGPQGPQGIQGPQGVQGIQGVQGETGNGIASIAKTSTSGLVDTYTITYTNGNTTTYDVTNGEDGEVTQEQLDEVQAELDRYKLLENALPHTENTTASDYVTLENTAKSPMEVTLIPQTSQDGEPTPDNPQDIHRTTGENQVKAVGKNLWNILENVSGTSVTTNDNEEYTLETSATTRTYTINGEENTSYTIDVTINANSSDINLNFVYSDNTTEYIGEMTNSSYQSKHFTKTSNSSKTLIGIKISTYSYSTKKYYTFIQPILVKGSTSENYLPYESTAYPLSLGNKEMYNINGVYDGFVYDEATDKFYINRMNGKTVFNGSENGWSKGTNNYNISQSEMKTTNVGFGLSNYFTNARIDYSYTAGKIRFGWNNSRLYFYVDMTSIAEIENWKSWLSTHNTIVVYQLATSTLEEITDSTLISQLRAIKNALSMQETTHIISTATGENLPFLIKARAVQNISNS